jgi:hypothetical protein
MGEEIEAERLKKLLKNAQLVHGERQDLKPGCLAPELSH